MAKAFDPTEKHVGSRVRARRLMLKMSQEKLGNELGISFQQVQKYEKGTNRISAGRLQHISRILDVPVPFFFEGIPSVDGKSRKESSLDPDQYFEVLRTADGLALVGAFARIPDVAVRRAFVRLIQMVAGRYN